MSIRSLNRRLDRLEKPKSRKRLTAAELLSRLQKSDDLLVRNWATKLLGNETKSEKAERKRREREEEKERERRWAEMERRLKAVEQKQRDELYAIELEESKEKRKRGRSRAMNQIRKLAKKDSGGKNES